MSSLLPGLGACDAGDANLRQLLTVADALVVASLVLVLVDADLRTLGLRDDLGLDRDLRELGRIGGDSFTVDEQDRQQRDLGTRSCVELLDLDHIALSDLVLLAAGLDDGVHRGSTPRTQRNSGLL